MISLTFSYGGVENHIMSSTNVFVNDLNQVNANFASNLGIGLALNNEIISKHELCEVYEYLDSKFF